MELTMTPSKLTLKLPLIFWRRIDGYWQLRANGRTYASIFHDYDHFTCFAVCASGHFYDVGPAIDLASAKTFLARRFGP